MKSIKRCQLVITLFLLMFIAGLGILTARIYKDAPFYITHSDNYRLGKVYDRNKDILFDGSGTVDIPVNHLIDVGNLIGDDKGQMENTLVAQNIDKLSNYSFNEGIDNKNGKAAIYTTLDHKANRAAYDAFMGADGCIVAYNYKTGEILVCTSLPNIDPTSGYEGLEYMKSGTLMSKAMYGTVPGSTQKVSTVITAMEILGQEGLFSKSYSCSGYYMNSTGGKIDCHNSWGHGTQNIQQAVENSCNPFFAQLVEDADMPLESITEVYTRLGYDVSSGESEENEENEKSEKPKQEYIDIDGIQCFKASTTLTDTADFATQWGCIGQGETLASPVQLMMWQSAIANETGKMTMPHIIKQVTDVKGNVTEKAQTKYSEQLFSEETAASVKQILLTNGANHYQYSIPGYKVAIKSGTAQVKHGNEENALLVGFVDDAKFPIAFCVVLENKYSTPAVAENIVTAMLNSLSK